MAMTTSDRRKGYVGKNANFRLVCLGLFLYSCVKVCGLKRCRDIGFGAGNMSPVGHCQVVCGFIGHLVCVQSFTSRTIQRIQLIYDHLQTRHCTTELYVSDI